MLKALNINNIALIEKLEMELCPGFNVMTGETGAGKSIVIDAVMLILGGRLERELIKNGQSKALVEAVFQVGKATLAFLEGLGYASDEDELFLSREITAAGKNNCRINGKLAPLSALKSVGDELVDMYGQHENQVLFDVQSHMGFVDDWDTAVAEIKDRLAELYHQWTKVRKLLKEELGSDEERNRRKELLRDKIEEIHKARLTPGEEEELLAESKVLRNAEGIVEALEDTWQCLEGDDGPGARELIRQAVSRLEGVAAFKPEYAQLKERLEEAYYAVEDVAFSVGREKDAVVFDPYRQEEVEQRLAAIYKLKRRYGSTVEEVIAAAADAQKELDAMDERDYLAKKGQARLKELERELYGVSKELGDKRRACAKALEEAVTGQLRQLAMESAVFVAHFEPFAQFKEGMSFLLSGLDKVEFMFSANAGQPPRPLRKVASGGELSRIMLAFKSVYAQQGDGRVLIFDEIDSGISGRAATVVGQKMRDLSCRHQVICVTHQAQIAAMAHRHFLIEKREQSGEAATFVRALTEEQRAQELARIVGGQGESALEYGRELLDGSKKTGSGE